MSIPQTLSDIVENVCCLTFFLSLVFIHNLAQRIIQKICAEWMNNKYIRNDINWTSTGLQKQIYKEWYQLLATGLQKQTKVHLLIL